VLSQLFEQAYGYWPPAPMTRSIPTRD
jgi:hypothetical protein